MPLRARSGSSCYDFATFPPTAALVNSALRLSGNGRQTFPEKYFRLKRSNRVLRQGQRPLKRQRCRLVPVITTG
jgi:hypothetical protein